MLTVIFDFDFDFLDVNVLGIFVDEIFGGKKFFGIINNNILNEILGVLMIIGSLLVAFSKEKDEDEDEFISKIRLESLVWATYLNYTVLFLAFIFVHDLSFLWVMIFNMFTILIFFIVRFNWQIIKFRKTAEI